jgi:hypothetical protein
MTRSEAFSEWHELSKMATEDQSKAFSEWRSAVRVRDAASEQHLAAIYAYADAPSPLAAEEERAATHGRHKAASEAADAAWDRYNRICDDGKAIVDEAWKTYEAAATDATP